MGKELYDITKQMRAHIIKMLAAAGSGHPGGSLSATDVVASLYFKHMHVDPENPDWEDRDRFVLSKGHAAPALYAALALKEDLCLDLQTPALKLEKVPNPGLENRAKEEKTALEWITEFKTDARRAAAGGGAEPDTDWLINTLAVRSLAESKRHKSGKLQQTRFSAAQIAERANQLMADRGVRGYVKSLKANPREYARAVELLQKGNGGRVEDQLTAYTVATKQVPFTTLGKRYRPTAKQMIELMQGTLKNPQSSTAEKQEALAAIIAVRKAEGVKRAALGLRADAALEKQITNYTRFQHTAELTLQDLKTLSQQEQSSLMEAACSGHGGAMLQSYDRLLQQAQAQPVQPQAQPVQAQPGKS
jgi:hypothetical protein